MTTTATTSALLISDSTGIAIVFFALFFSLLLHFIFYALWPVKSFNIKV